MITPLTDDLGLGVALGAEIAVIYKHSPRCGAATTAGEEVRRFAEEHPAVLVFQVDVVRDRSLSQTIARRLGVRHESPQALLLRKGAVAWSGSHWDVRAETLARQLVPAAPD